MATRDCQLVTQVVPRVKIDQLISMTNTILEILSAPRARRFYAGVHSLMRGYSVEEDVPWYLTDHVASKCVSAAP